jgi:uncharacterized protein (TIGR02266 family)
MTKGQRDQRTAARVPIRVKVEYAEIEDFLADYSCNVSLGGMFIETEDPLPIGTRFRLRLQLPNRKLPLETFAEVRWIIDPGTPGQEAGMGVRFEAVGHAERREIERLLDGEDA